MKPAAGNQRARLFGVVAAVVILVALLVAGGAWVVSYVADNIGAPGPGATGNGPCGSADAVNIQLTFADGHTVQACTRDRPACPNQTVTGTSVGQSTTSVSELTLSNQLRSSSRRYIFFVRTEFAVLADMAEQTLQLDPTFAMPGPVAAPPGSGTSPRAEIQVTPRDPQEDGATAISGSMTVSSAHNLVRGRIDGSFTNGPGRSDRPQPSPHWSPIKITGTFVCNS